MNSAAESGMPVTELEALAADLSASGSVVFVVGVGWLTTHLRGVTHPVFRGPPDRRWWHVELGGEESEWVLDVRLDEIGVVRFAREPNPFPGFPGEESLTVRFEKPGSETALYCYLDDLYDGERLRPDRAAIWEGLRRRYGDRDESTVISGSLKPAAVAA